MKKQLWYCKVRKSKGDPITVIDLDTNKETHTDCIEMRNVNIRMRFNNAKAGAKASGATTVLEVWRNKR